VVKITVVQPTIFLSLEKAIEQQYGIRQAIVVDVGENASNAQIKHAIGSAAAHYVETRVRRKTRWGSRLEQHIRCMVDEMHPQNIRAEGLFSCWAAGPNGNVQATILTQQLAAHLGCPAWLLPSQSIEHSVEERAGW
jgi:DNA-binding transcriptional regulator LsrR (DeoR family)